MEFRVGEVNGLGEFAVLAGHGNANRVISVRIWSKGGIGDVDFSHDGTVTTRQFVWSGGEVCQKRVCGDMLVIISGHSD
jgi:hypothetical protein